MNKKIGTLVMLIRYNFPGPTTRKISSWESVFKGELMFPLHGQDVTPTSYI